MLRIGKRELAKRTISRRRALALLARTTTLLSPAALLGGCAVSGALDPTAALPRGGATEATANGARRAPGEAIAPAKAALLLPLSASIQLSLVAKGLQQSAELALFELNATALQLIVRDDKGTPDGAAAAAAQAVADGAEIILGPLLGTSVSAMASFARKSNVPVIAFSNDVSNGGEGVHLLSFFAATEADRIGSFAAAQGRRHFAALVPDDALGRDMEPALRSSVERGGAQLAVVERYSPDLSGMTEPSQRIMEAIASSAASEHPIDALFIPASGDNAPRLAAMLRHHALDTSRVKVIISTGWDNPSTLRAPKLLGAWLAGPDPRGWNEFSARFAKAYKSMPPRLASLAYDAVLVASAFATQPKGSRYTPANLMRDSGFAGVDGQFRLTARGPIQRGLAVIEIQQQGPVVIDAAADVSPAAAQRAPRVVGSRLIPG